VQKHAAEQTSSCSVCGTMYEAAASDLPRNPFIQKLIRLNAVANVAAARQAPCDVCKSQEEPESEGSGAQASIATYYCTSCAESLCSMYAAFSALHFHMQTFSSPAAAFSGRIIFYSVV